MHLAGIGVWVLVSITVVLVLIAAFLFCCGILAIWYSKLAAPKGADEQETIDVKSVGALTKTVKKSRDGTTTIILECICGNVACADASPGVPMEDDVMCSLNRKCRFEETKVRCRRVYPKNARAKMSKIRHDEMKALSSYGNIYQ